MASMQIRPDEITKILKERIEGIEQASADLAEVGEAPTPHAAYAWYCAGEADLGVDVERAKTRLERAIVLAEQTNASFVIGVAGATKASIEARRGDPFVAAEDYRRLITHWRRAGKQPRRPAGR